MRLVLAFLFFVATSTLAFGDEVKVELNPERPVAGDVFQAVFRIFTESGEEPQITFTPSSLEVVGKANQGVSTRAVYANGKYTVTREVTVVYDLVASKPGVAGLRDITVQLGTQNLRHSPITLTVVREPEVAAELFVMADVPKKKILLGEGITVRYYLYNKVSFNNLDVKKYPKLNNFLKRFLQEPERTERVSVNGEIYQRTQIYAAKLFPEKVGDLKVDPLRISVTYAVSNPADPFGSFGFNRQLRTKTLSSPPVTVEVRALPAPIPPHFTGLIGRHEFQLEFNQQKLIVNEPLEVKLTISGGGALENLEAPTILKHPGLEEFESNGDLKIADADQATKIFDYTFLAKENLTVPAGEISLSYLDPDSEKYVVTKLPVPEIVVAGGQATSAPAAPERRTEDGAKAPAAQPHAPSLAPPVTETRAGLRTWLPVVNTSLAVVSLLIALSFFIKKGDYRFSRRAPPIPTEFRKGDFQFGTFVKWMTPLIQRSGKSPLAIIRDSDLPEDSKAYFSELINANDSMIYSSKKTDLNFTYRAAHFKNLSRYIESAKNENPSQPS